MLNSAMFALNWLLLKGLLKIELSYIRFGYHVFHITILCKMPNILFYIMAPFLILVGLHPMVHIHHILIPPSNFTLKPL